MAQRPSRFLGHVVLNVRDVAVSVPFYREVLGLKEVARNGVPMVFLSFGINDHDVALRQVGQTANAHDGSAVGLMHVAFRIGETLDELKAFRSHLEARGVAIKRIDEHAAITSLYFSDPDGIELEGYIERSVEARRGERQAVRFSRPVRLD
jgi:catechol 2,3-dioxygenase